MTVSSMSTCPRYDAGREVFRLCNVRTPFYINLDTYRCSIANDDFSNPVVDQALPARSVNNRYDRGGQPAASTHRIKGATEVVGDNTGVNSERALVRR